MWERIYHKPLVDQGIFRRIYRVQLRALFCDAATDKFISENSGALAHILEYH